MFDEGVESAIQPGLYKNTSGYNRGISVTAMTELYMHCNNFKSHYKKTRVLCPNGQEKT